MRLAIRVGGLEGRMADEQVTLGEGVVGQETVGAGGVAYGLRTVPEAVRIAQRVAELAPEALRRLTCTMIDGWSRAGCTAR
jgi:6-phospho-beta-glucosidase